MTIVSAESYPVKYKNKIERRKFAEECAETARVLFRHVRRGWYKKLSVENSSWMKHFPMPLRSSARGKGGPFIFAPLHASSAQGVSDRTCFTSLRVYS